MQAWEYTFIDIREGTPTTKATEKEMNDRLNKYGKQGWECFSIKEHREYDQVIAYFKRPVS